MRKAKRFFGLGALHIFLLAICFFTMIPILYALSVSLSANNSLLASDFSLIPKAITLKNYADVFLKQPILKWAGNSAALAGFTVLLSLAFAVPAAYMFSRRKFKGRKAILRMLILLYSFPQILSMFAIYKLMSTLGLINTQIGLIFIYTGTMSVFSLWNLKGYFDTIPVDLEEAAKIDGCNEGKIIRHIVLPLAQPSIIVTAVMVLIFVWNEYIFSIQFMTGESSYTLAAGLYSLQATEMSGSWPVFAAASLVVSLPVLIIFFLSQRHMVSGLTAGGVKG